MPRPTERQRVRDEIKAALIFARVNFVNVRGGKFAGVFLEGSVS